MKRKKKTKTKVIGREKRIKLLIKGKERKKERKKMKEKCKSKKG